MGEDLALKIKKNFTITLTYLHFKLKVKKFFLRSVFSKFEIDLFAFQFDSGGLFFGG